MKKLMIAAAAALVGVVASAASIDWSTAAKSFTMSDGSYPDGQTIYLLNATDAEAFTAFKTALEAGELGENLAAAMASEKWSALGPQTGTTMEKGTMTSGKWAKNYAYGTGTIDAAKDATQYSYAIFVADGENYLISDAKQGLSYSASPDDGEAAKFFDTDFGSWAKYESAGGDVPEPTSGLLLLLGMAGLALRRKQA